MKRVVWSIMGSLVALGALAEEPPMPLAEAIALAAEQAPALTARQTSVQSAQHLSDSAGRLPDPELVVGVDNLPINTADAYSFTRDFMTMRKVGVMQSFPNAAKRRLQKARAGAQVEVAAAQWVETQLDVKRRAAEAWVSVFAAELGLRRLRELKPEFELQVVASRAQVTGGRGSSADVVAALGARGELEDRIAEAERDVRQARAELARWVGPAATRPLAEAPSFVVTPEQTQRLLATTHEHGAIQSLTAMAKTARVDVDLARAEKRPDWSAELAFAKRGPDFSNMVSLEFRVGLPLFAKHRQNPVIAAQYERLRGVEAQRDDELREHVAMLQTVIAAWETAQLRAARFERELIPLARERGQLALVAYRAGRSPLKPVLDAFEAEVDVTRTYATVLGDLGRSWAYLNFLKVE